MVETATAPKSTDFMTVLEGFEAIGPFLETTWRRHGMPAEEIAFILGGTKWVDGTPVDPAMWQDWLAAVQMSRGVAGEDALSANA